MENLVLREILENVSVMLAYFDNKFNFLAVNKAFAKGYGYKPEELVGKNYFELFSSEKNGKIFDYVKKTGQRVNFFNEPFEYPDQPDRGATYWDGVLFSVKDETGQIHGFVLSFSEATERRQMEQKLKASEESLRRLFNQAPDSIIIFDLNGIITDCNPTCFSFTGFSREDFMGKSFVDLTNLLDGTYDFTNIFSKLSDGKTVEPFEVTFRDSKNEQHFGEIHISLLRTDAELSGFQAVMRDVTKRKKAEKALQESVKRFKELGEMLPEVIFETDSKGLLTFVNKGAYERFGYSATEFANGLTAFTMIAPEDRELAKANFGKLLFGEETSPRQYTAITKDGRRFPMIINSCPIVHENKVVGIRGVMVDITEYMKTEDALKETLGHLETLNEKLRVIGKSTRHDVRNKLSVIVNNIFLAKQKLSKNESVQNYLDQIEVAVEQIANIFDFSRTYERLGTEKLTQIDVEKMVNEAFQLVSNSDSVQLINECKGLTITADSLLRQFFCNLIDDSIKHGETVTQIKVYYKNEGDTLKLVYEDNGVGIEESEKQKIFQEGYGKGTGYGLYLVQKTCDVYRWAVKETGTHGKGAQFTITIPKESTD